MPAGVARGSPLVALVPARGGSRGIRRKNLIDFSGRPLVAWTVETARRAACVGRVVVSTDDPEIARAARLAGAEVPFLRPKRLATDASPTVDAVIHACSWLLARGVRAETPLAVLQPTSPLRTARDIEKAALLFHAGRTGSVVSAQPLDKVHPWWALLETGDGTVRPAFPGKLKAVRQSLPRAYAPNGAIYIARLADIVKRKTLYIPPIRCHVMDAERSIDIDTPADYAQALLAWRKHH